MIIIIVFTQLHYSFKHSYQILKIVLNIFYVFQSYW